MGVRGASTALRFRAYSLLLVLSAFCISTTASGFPSVDACPKFSNEEYLVLQEDLCIRDVDGNPVASAIAPRVAEVNGTTLERALKLLQSKGDAYVAVLYYANWCPFSRVLRSLLDTLSSDFPAIYHIAVEDSAIQPRTKVIILVSSQQPKGAENLSSLLLSLSHASSSIFPAYLLMRSMHNWIYAKKMSWG